MRKFCKGDKVRIVSKEQMLEYRTNNIAFGDGRYEGCTPGGLYINHTMFAMAGQEVTIRFLLSSDRYRLEESGFVWDEYVLESADDAATDYEALSRSLSSSLMSLLNLKEV